MRDRGAEGDGALHRAEGLDRVDGISLTVNEVDGARFGVNIIPITQTATNLGQARSGDRVNLEIDLIARYVARLLAPARITGKDTIIRNG